MTLPVQLSPPVHRALSFQWEPMWEPQENLSVFPTDFCISSSHDALAMGDHVGDAADPRRASSALSRSWQLILAPWSEAQRAALRRFGNNESSVLLFALRTDGGKLEVFVTCKAPRRAAWLSTHVIEGKWRPAASPKTKGERCNLLAQYQECCDRSNQGQRANVPASAALPARPPKDSEGLQAARPPEDREDLGGEDLSLPPLSAVSIEPRQLAPAPSPASMFSLPPGQRTAADSTAAERAAKRAAKVRRAVRHQQMLEEYERALDFERIRGSAAWRRICDPSDDEGIMPCPEACGAVWEEEGEAEDEAAEDEADDDSPISFRGYSLRRVRAYKSEMGDKKGDDQATADRPAATSSSSGWLRGYTLSRKYGSLAGDRGVKPGGIRPSTSSGDFVEGVHPWDLE